MPLIDSDTEVMCSSPTASCRNVFTRGPGGTTSPPDHSSAKYGLAAESLRMKSSQAGSPTCLPYDDRMVATINGSSLSRNTTGQFGSGTVNSVHSALGTPTWSVCGTKNRSR